MEGVGGQLPNLDMLNALIRLIQENRILYRLSAEGNYDKFIQYVPQGKLEFITASFVNILIIALSIRVSQVCDDAIRDPGNFRLQSNDGRAPWRPQSPFQVDPLCYISLVAFG